MLSKCIDKAPVGRGGGLMDFSRGTNVTSITRILLALRRGIIYCPIEVGKALETYSPAWFYHLGVTCGVTKAIRLSCHMIHDVQLQSIVKKSFLSHLLGI